MSDPTSTEPADEGDGETRDIVRLREHAKRQEAEADALRAQNRALTFQAAGVDLDSPVGKLFNTAYSGDLTVDAVKTGWAEVAPQSAAAPAVVDDGPTPEELANAAARQSLTTGGVPPGEEPTADPWPDALAGFNADRAKGVRVEAAQHNALQKIVDAAAAGDERVIFDEAAWKAQFR